MVRLPELSDELHWCRFYEYLHIDVYWQMDDLQMFIISITPLSTLNDSNIGTVEDIDLSFLVHLNGLRCTTFKNTDIEALARLNELKHCPQQPFNSHVLVM